MMLLKQQQPSSQAPQSGFTLIECLLAIIIVSVLMVAIAPAITLSVATRVQARRVELATQAARTYVDGLRAGTIPAPPQQNAVFLKQDKTNPLNQNLFGGAGAPSGSAGGWTCTPTLPTPTTGQPAVYCADGSGLLYLYCVDLDGGGCNSSSHRDLIIEPLRSIAPSSTDPNVAATSDDGSNGYILSLRVYRADGFNGGPLRTTPVDSQGRVKRPLAYTAGTGDRKAPLVELTTEIRSNGTNWSSLCARLGGCTAPAASTTPSPTPSPTTSP